MSEMYAIKTSTMNAIGDAIRSKGGVSKEDYFIEESFELTYAPDSWYPIYYGTQKYQMLDTIKTLKVKLTINFDLPEDGLIGIFYKPGYESNPLSSGFIQLDFTNSKTVEFTTNSNAISFMAKKHFNYNSILLSFNVEIVGFDENGELPYRYTPIEMADAINGFTTVPDKALAITGDGTYRFAYGGWDWFVESCGNKITTSDITDASNMFIQTDLDNIPFDINMKKSSADTDYMFSNSNSLKALPIINNLVLKKMDNMFYSMFRIREIPEEIYNTWDFSYIDGLTSEWSGGAWNNAFSYCYSLRSLPMKLLEHGNPYIYYGSSNYAGLGYGCHSLDEIIDLPYAHHKATWTSNVFTNFCYNASRIKEMTFKMPDGMPYVVKWKSQTINLQSVGYANSISYFVNYNAGITADKEVKDDATYQALKNDPDWFSCDINYCRYNHDSAVNTINSLPDTSAYLASAGGTNTIQFKGVAGAKTDGGAINTLTEEEIAVAAAKGWTVSLA